MEKTFANCYEEQAKKKKIMGHVLTLSPQDITQLSFFFSTFIFYCSGLHNTPLGRFFFTAQLTKKTRHCVHMLYSDRSSVGGQWCVLYGGRKINK